MANSIRVKSACEYTIEVNDNGDRISFDTSDVSLHTRVYKMQERIDDLVKQLEIDSKVINDRPDEILYQYNEQAKITKNQRDTDVLIEKFYADSREAVDLVFGDGACQKIFGDKNYYEMFNDLMEQMEPHLKKMGINAEKHKKVIAQKYMPNREARRALK